MSVQTGDLVKAIFTTTNPATGAAADADSLPTGVLWVDGVADAATVTIADATGTGSYTFSVTMPTLTTGQRVQVRVDATIGGVACAGVVWEDQATPAVNVTLQAGVAVAAADADGHIPVDVQKMRGNASAASGVEWLGSQADETGYIDVNVHQWRTATANLLISGNVPVSDQAIRDAMKLAPSAGVPAAGSVDEHLDAILEDTGTTLPAAIAAIDTSGMAEAVWEYTTRTLTQSSTSTTDSTAAGSIARRRGDSWSISLTIGAITGYTSLWFTAKWDRDNTDAESVLQVKKNASGSGDGLLYVNGATAANAALGSITVTDATTGAIVIAVDETVTDDLSPAGIYYDVQVLNAGSVSTLDSGTLTISADVTRAVA